MVKKFCTHDYKETPIENPGQETLKVTKTHEERSGLETHSEIPVAHDH